MRFLTSCIIKLHQKLIKNVFNYLIYTFSQLEIGYIGDFGVNVASRNDSTGLSKLGCENV